jgi:hypothetical protein
MRITTLIGGGILTGIVGNALACDLPKLAVIPPKNQVAGKEAEILAAAKTYFTAMEAYSACNLAELTSAGGDSAPELIRQVLVRRINAARTEEDFMMKLLEANVGKSSPPPPAENAGQPVPN